jgi:hypothetical protein
VLKKPFYPFLFPLFSVFSLFSHNAEEIPLIHLVTPVLLALLLSIVFFFAAKQLTKENHKAGLISFVALFLFFSYLPLLYLLKVEAGWHTLSWPLFFAIITFFILLLAFRVSRLKSPSPNFTKTLNFVVIILLIMPVYSGSIHKIKSAMLSSKLQNAGNAPTIKPVPALSGQRPDIYYLIFDRYAGEETLKNIYRFDNSAFYAFLRQKGFYVAGKSFANYPKTAHSLLSSLNMKYINDLSLTAGENCANWQLIFDQLQDYKLWRYLKGKGYKFIHIGSWWAPTSVNRYADININFRLSEFTMRFIENTMAYPLLEHTGVFGFREFHRKRALYQMEKLNAIPGGNGPVFVFAHILLPHPPWAFTRDGKFLEEKILYKRSNDENYINQLVYTNSLIKRLIDTLMTRSRTPPIIVIQADEGPFPARYRKHEDTFDWRTAEKSELRIKSLILNAYYLPGFDTGSLYPGITPVNSWRVILNHYFNENFEKMPDECWIFQDKSHPYKFLNITGLIKSD